MPLPSERIIKQALEGGLAHFLSNKARLDEVFVGMSATDRQKVWDALTAKRPNVYLGFKRTGIHYPCWLVTLESQTPTITPTALEGPDSKLFSGYRDIVQVLVLARNPDEASLHGALARACVNVYRRWIICLDGVHSIDFASAADLEPLPGMGESEPEFIFQRAAQWTIGTEEELSLPSALSPLPSELIESADDLLVHRVGYFTPDAQGTLIEGGLDAVRPDEP